MKYFSYQISFEYNDIYQSAFTLGYHAQHNVKQRILKEVCQFSSHLSLMVTHRMASIRRSLLINSINSCIRTLNSKEELSFRSLLLLSWHHERHLVVSRQASDCSTSLATRNTSKLVSPSIPRELANCNVYGTEILNKFI